MPKRGLLFMLPMRQRVAYPGVDDEIITLPEIKLPPGESPGGAPAIPPAESFDFPVREIGQYLVWAHQNTPSPATHPKTSLTFHWEGESASLPQSDDETAQWLGAISAQHVQKDWGGGSRGSGIMYHEAIARSGTSLVMRDYQDVVWHSGDMEGNRSSRAILVVCSTVMPPTDAQLRAIRKRTVDFNVSVWAHSDWSATQCPGDQIRSLVSNLREHGYA